MTPKTTSTTRRVQTGKLLIAVAACYLLYSGICETRAMTTYVQDLKGSVVPVQSYDVSEPLIALTFDVGTSNHEHLIDILNQLRKDHLHATFFLTGDWVEKHPRTALAIVQQGHEVGHLLYGVREASNLSGMELQAQLDKFDAVWKQAGLPDSDLIRVPDVKRLNTSITKQIRERHETLISWSMDATSIPRQDPATVWSGWEHSLQPGDILRLRTDDDATSHLPELLHLVQGAGFRWTTCSDLQEKGAEI